MQTEELRKQEAVVEAVLFAMGRSVEIRQLAAALETGEKEAEAAAERLRERYEAEESGIQVVRLEDSYQMCTRSRYYGNLIRVASTPKKQVLTDVVLETLAIIAYKQPVTKADIEKIRGVKSDHAVNRLIEYDLVYEAGRLDAPGRPSLFATTEEFLRRFGVGSTGDLPEMDLEKKEEIRTEVEEELNLKLDPEGNLQEEADTEASGEADTVGAYAGPDGSAGEDTEKEDTEDTGTEDTDKKETGTEDRDTDTERKQEEETYR